MTRASVNVLIVLLLVAFKVQAESSKPSCGFKVEYQVLNIDRIPRYHQANDLGENYSFMEKDSSNDSSLCFGASAAQAIDLMRISKLGGNSANFRPSSPLLLGSRFQHLFKTENGSVGGLGDAVIKESFRLGSCDTLVDANSYADGLFTIRDEIDAVLRHRAKAESSISQEKVIKGVFSGLNQEFFDATYTLCQPGRGSKSFEDDKYGVKVYHGEALKIPEDQWTAALKDAETSSLGSQVVVVELCEEAILGKPYANSGSNISCGWHYVAVMGKRCPVASSKGASCQAETECEILVRDSYANDTLPKNTKFYTGIANDKNDYWLPESVIRSATKEASVIQSLSERIAVPSEAPAFENKIGQESVESPEDEADGDTDP